YERDKQDNAGHHKFFNGCHPERSRYPSAREEARGRGTLRLLSSQSLNHPTTDYVNFTATGSRSPSGASKNCRSLNPNIPARMLVGKLWILVFRSRTTAL